MSISARSPSIRVVFVDDHPMLRAGTQVLLAQAPGIELVGVADAGTVALQQVATLHPHVLILDLRLPDMSGLEVARQVRQDSPEVAILVLTGFNDSGYVRALRQLGVRGYLDKSVTGSQIIAAIRAVAAGEIIFVPEATRGTAGPTEPLTAREHEVLRLLVAGRRNKEMAQALGVSQKTVEFHITNLFVKLHAQSRTEVALRARDLGLLDAL